MVRTQERAYIESIILHPDILPHVKDDSFDASWRAPINEYTHWLRPEEGGAVFCVFPVETVLWEVHSAVLKSHRRSSLEYVKGVREYLRTQTPCRCLQTKVVSGNYPAARLAEAIGMQKVGVLPRSRLAGGVLHDQALYVMEI